MNSDKIHVYFVPGLAAGKEIFRSIQLPAEQFEIHILEWLIPEKKESLQQYAQRMASLIKESNPILVGVSFGGVVVQEMSAFVKLRKLIIISSVKTKYELPTRLKFARKTRIYRLLPTRLVINSKDLTKYSVGPRSKKRLKIYQEYLHVRDKRYLDWAIKNMVCWDREESLEGVIHLHGDKDVVFPIKNIKNCTVIEEGTHIMLVNKGKQVSSKLLEAIIK